MRAAFVLSLAVLIAGVTIPARADEPPAPASSSSSSSAAAAAAAAAASEDDPTVVAARREFVQGAELVKQERWAEALSAFERADKLKPHAITSYNIAQCERAMGQYTRARRGLVAALAQDEAAHGAELPDSARTEAQALLAELDHLLARANVTLRPGDAAVTVDGRPLDLAPDGATFVAGTAAPGPGAPPNREKLAIVMNPGAHVITVSRRGYQDVVVNRTFPPGSTSAVDLELDRLPAAIHVTSNLRDAIVKVNGADVGNPPVDVSRVAGSYQVTVSRKGFVGYEAEVAMRPGERVDLAANLREERPALTQRWWFWGAAGVLVVGAAVTTYFLTRSDPQPTRPATDGGGLGWSLKVP